jgi:hypothetical protein
MRPRQLRTLEFHGFKVDTLAQEQPAPQPQAKPNHKMRRVQASFNRKLARRLKKDGTNASVKIMPDGGVHIEVQAEQPAAAPEVVTVVGGDQAYDPPEPE